jgi:hypothetical protein
MKSAIQKIVGILAIYVIALNTILGTVLAPLPTGTAFDPLSVICHSTAAADRAPASDGQPTTPSKACDHCTLCGATASPALSVDAVLAATLEPGTLIAELRPTEGPRHAGAVRSSNLARGPPLSA